MVSPRNYSVSPQTNASNNGTICKELEKLLIDLNSISWSADENHVKCLAHVINVSVKSFLKNIKVVPLTDVEQFSVPQIPKGSKYISKSTGRLKATTLSNQAAAGKEP